MKFELVNNYIILGVETDLGLKNCLLDTGCSKSFFFDGVRECEIDGRALSVSMNPIAQFVRPHKANIEKKVGVTVDGFIGVEDFPGECVAIDFPNKTFCVSTDSLPAGAIEMNSLDGLPVFQMSINGIVLKAAFDSAAMYSFVHSRLTDKLNLTAQDKTYEDFIPTIGHFTADLYRGEIKIGDVNLGLRNIAAAGGYDQLLGMVGADAFLCTDSLEESVVWLSYRDRQMVVS